MTDRRPVSDVNEIPRFASEDDERVWWETHELTPHLWERLRPRWDELPFLLPLGIAAADSPQVRWELDIAGRYLQLAARSLRRTKQRNGEVPESALMNSVVSLVFSAAAVEAALNLYLTAPYFRFSEDAQEVQQVDVPPEAHLPVREKLRRVVEESTALRSDTALLEEVERLLDRRDRVLHAVYALDGPSADDIDAASDYLEAAHRFAETLALPSGQPVR